MIKLLRSREGQIVISVILGFGLATLFRRACKGRSCVVIKGPKLSEVQNFVYRMDNHCYRYKPAVVGCGEDGGSPQEDNDGDSVVV